MNFSKYFIYIPYRLTWTFKRAFRKKTSVHFYCAGHVDYVVMEPIIRHFPEAVLVSKNRKVQKELLGYGIVSKVYPTFPDVLIIPRHTARKFPEPRIKKVGLRHGAYHFKDFVKASRYHAFDLYFVTSQAEVERAVEKGIKNTKAVGFPKLDPLFNGEYTEEKLESLRHQIGVDKNKQTVLFTTTWDKSGTSAIERWINRLNELTQKYNVLVTVHQWTNAKYISTLRKTEQIFFIEDKNILPYLCIADVMVADLSSIIAEFCALNKPIITFVVPDGKRTPHEIKTMLEEISIRVGSFDELKSAIVSALANPAEQSTARLKYNTIMFDTLDGQAGIRAANLIKTRLIDEYNSPNSRNISN